MTGCTLYGELDFVFIGADGKAIGKLLELFADLGELCRVDSDDGSVLSVWDAEVLNVKGDEVEGELGGSSSLLILKGDFQSAWILISLQSDGILWISELHHFRQVCDINSENLILVASVLFEAFHTQIEGNQCNMTGVHCLQGDA